MAWEWASEETMTGPCLYAQVITGLADTVFRGTIALLNGKGGMVKRQSYWTW